MGGEEAQTGPHLGYLGQHSSLCSLHSFSVVQCAFIPMQEAWDIERTFASDKTTPRRVGSVVNSQTCLS